MNENDSTVPSVSGVQQAPPSKYLWTADGWIRGLRKTAEERLLSIPSGAAPPAQEARA